MVISASLQACGVVFPFAMLTSICRSIVTICSGLYLLIGMTRFSSKWILSHSTWYKFRRSGQFVCAVAPGAGESCVELRFCESDDARWTSAAHPGGDRRIY